MLALPGKEVAFCRQVAAVAAAAADDDLARFRAELGGAAEVPARLAAVRTRTNVFGSDWATFTGEEQVRTQLHAPGDCRVRSADGASQSLSMTAYATAVLKFMLGGLQEELSAVDATPAQKKAVWRGVAVHMNGLWASEGRRNRLLETADQQKLKYTLDPFSEEQQYRGGCDDRSARRKASAKPSNKARRAPTYL